MNEYWYRYTDYVSGTEDYRSITIQCSKFLVAKHTPKGVRFVGHNAPWVSNTARKRFAYPTIEEAWESFKHRKRRQVGIYSAKLNHAKIVLTATKNPPSEKPICLGELTFLND